MGFHRNLTAEEIVGQVYAVKVMMRLAVRNVVFMGMGEPLDNFDGLIQAIRIMEDQRGLNIAKRRMTVSTVGLVDGIRKLSEFNWPQIKLAISLNAGDDALRSRLMPINSRYPMAELRAVLERFPLARGNALFVEYLLIKGINDRREHARQLAAYLKGLPVKLNLIPLNSTPNFPYLAPSYEDISCFQQALIDEEIFVRLRSTKGADIRAACGQLGGKGRG